MRRLLLAVVFAELAAALVVACGARSELDVGAPQGTGGGLIEPDGAVPDASRPDAPPDVITHDVTVPDATMDASTCPPGTVTAYLVTQGGGTGRLFTFVPETLATTPVGTFTCPTSAQAWTLTASASGLLYVMATDWKIYAVDPSTLSCEATPYQLGQLGISGGDTPFTVAPGFGGERLLLVGAGDGGPILAQADLQGFALSKVGPLGVTTWPLDIRADAFGRVYAFAETGEFFSIDAATGAATTPVQTGFASGSNWALLTWNEDVYLFAGNSVARYDVHTNTVTPLGSLQGNVVGASAAPCLH
ncbi:MAG TPA: hypothetical protein VHB21_18805 [Minicystis sp.]|nr:hypothetical protein [Minicystis sp.]